MKEGQNGESKWNSFEVTRIMTEGDEQRESLRPETSKLINVIVNIMVNHLLPTRFDA